MDMKERGPRQRRSFDDSQEPRRSFEHGREPRRSFDDGRERTVRWPPACRPAPALQPAGQRDELEYAAREEEHDRRRHEQQQGDEGVRTVEAILAPELQREMDAALAEVGVAIGPSADRGYQQRQHKAFEVVRKIRSRAPDRPPGRRFG